MSGDRGAQVSRLGQLIVGALTADRDALGALLDGDPEPVRERGAAVIEDIEARVRKVAAAKGPPRKVLNQGHRVHVGQVLDRDDDEGKERRK